MYILVETEDFVPEYKYEEEYSTYEEAYERMKQIYHEIATNDNPIIDGGEILSNTAYITFEDGNAIEWNIIES